MRKSKPFTAVCTNKPRKSRWVSFLELMARHADAMSLIGGVPMIPPYDEENS